MNDIINQETFKYTKKIAIVTINGYKYMVYTIPNFNNYILHASKMIKLNNIINLVEINNEEKNIVLNIIVGVYGSIYEKDIENLEKTDTPKKRIRTINNKQNGYINFYLILISTIFLSLLCILLSFMMLGLNIK